MNRWTLSTVMALALIPSLAAAQATTGEITGRVEDSAGAIVPGRHRHAPTTATPASCAAR